MDRLISALLLFCTLVSFKSGRAFGHDDPAYDSETIRMGLYTLDVPADPEAAAQRLAGLKDMGFSFGYVNTYQQPPSDKLMSVAELMDFAIVPHLNTYNAPFNPKWAPPLNKGRKPIPPPSEGYQGIYNVGEENWAQRFSDGSYAMAAWGQGYPYADPLAPQARESMRDAVAATAKVLARYPHAGKMISFDDEYWYAYDYAGRGMPIYSTWARQTIKDLSGYDGQRLEWPREPGYIAEGSDPFVAVRYTVGYRQGFYGPTLGLHAQDLSRVLKRISPNTSDFTTPGAYGGETDITMVELYDSMYNTNVLHDAFDVELARATSGPKGRIYALIGWWDAQPPDLEYMARRINTASRLAMLRGAEGVAFGPAQRILSTPQWNEQALKSSADAKQFGPLLRQLEFVQPRVGLLWSDTTVSHQQAQDWPKIAADAKEKKFSEKPWEHLHSVAELAYGALCCAGHPPRVITEEQVLDGVLDDLDVLVLIDHQFSETRLARKYDEFAERGGYVIADKSTAVMPQGTQVINFDATAWSQAIIDGKRYGGGPDTGKMLATYHLNDGLSQELAKQLRNAIREHDVRRFFRKQAPGHIIAYEARAAGNRYLLAINSDVTHQWEEPIEFRHDGGAVYDLTAGGKVLENPSNLNLGPGEWAIWMLAPRKAGKIGAQLALDRDPALVRCYVWDDEGFPMSGVIPFTAVAAHKSFRGVAIHGAGNLWLPMRVGDESVSIEVLGQSVSAPRLTEEGRP